MILEIIQAKFIISQMRKQRSREVKMFAQGTQLVNIRNDILIRTVVQNRTSYRTTNMLICMYYLVTMMAHAPFTQNVIWEPAAFEPPESLLDMQTLRSHPRLIE